MTDIFRSDLAVERLSEALAGKSFDWIVTGSVGAVEAPRMLRALRRLGADMTPWLTHGGAQFVTETALHWAADAACISQFSGSSHHIAEKDALIIAPASADFIAKMAAGLADDPATCVAQSYLGQKKPIFILPAMHASLAEAPAQKKAREFLQPYVEFLLPRLEEGKWKVGDPEKIADEISHRFFAKKSEAIRTDQHGINPRLYG